MGNDMVMLYEKGATTASVHNDMVMLYEKGAITASVLYNPICVRVQSYRTELHHHSGFTGHRSERKVKKQNSVPLGIRLPGAQGEGYDQEGTDGASEEVSHSGLRGG